jgi:hypothetical protein
LKTNGFPAPGGHYDQTIITVQQGIDNGLLLFPKTIESKVIFKGREEGSVLIGHYILSWEEQK